MISWLLPQQECPGSVKLFFLCLSKTNHSDDDDKQRYAKLKRPVPLHYSYETCSNALEQGNYIIRPSKRQMHVKNNNSENKTNNKRKLVETMHKRYFLNNSNHTKVINRDFKISSRAHLKSAAEAKLAALIMMASDWHSLGACNRDNYRND